MSNFPRLILFLLGLFLIFISLASIFDLVAGAGAIGSYTFAPPTPFTYLITETPATPAVPANPATATVAAAFTQLAASTQTIPLTMTASSTSTFAPTATFTPTVPSNTIVLGSHAVRPGEYLYCIGRAYGVIPEAIANFNSFPLESPLIAGQILQIPDVQWMNIPAGRVCEAQFESPYAATPSPTPTSVIGLLPGGPDHVIDDGPQLISFGGPNEILNQSKLQSTPSAVTATPVPNREVRTVYVEWPIELQLGESEIVIMTFNPGTGQTTIETPTEPGETPPTPTSGPNSLRNSDSSEPINILYRTDEYRIFAIARLDAAGFDYSPSEVVQKEVTIGKELEWRWSIKPQDAQTQQLIARLWLHYEPMSDKVPPPDEDIWNKSFQVNVTKDLMQSFFGAQTGLASAFGLVLGLVLSSFSIGKQAYTGLLWIGQKIRPADKSSDVE